LQFQYDKASGDNKVDIVSSQVMNVNITYDLLACLDVWTRDFKVCQQGKLYHALYVRNLTDKTMSFHLCGKDSQSEKDQLAPGQMKPLIKSSLVDDNVSLVSS
jgi:hypothetical protein